MGQQISALFGGGSASKVKTLYFIRHGESEWNKGQDMRSVWAVCSMIMQQDHPLSSRGVRQVKQLEEAMAGPVGKDMMQAKTVLCSPLTRAGQTAVVGLAPLLRQPGMTLRLVPQMRERRNYGGRDSSGTRIGAGVIDKLKQNIPEEYHDITKKINYVDVEAQWWSDEAEDEAAITSRIRGFVEQLRGMPTSAILVGHSHFFRDLFRTLRTAGDERVPEQFCQQKMDNCAVAAVTLDFSMHEGRITQARMLHGNFAQ